jgi:integrase
VNLRRPSIPVRKTTGKSGKARRMPLWDAGTLANLEAWKAERQNQGAGPGEPFICSQAHGSFGKRLDRYNVRKRFLAACKAMGPERCEEITIHTGRHTFVSQALAGGRSLAEVRDAAGHSNVSITSVYTHVATDGDEGVGELFGVE